MKLYLINKNPIISKLVALSASKLGVEVVESQEIDTNLTAEVVLLDDECYEEEALSAYRQAHSYSKITLFYAKSTERIEGFDSYIQKPFLPTDLVKTLSEILGIEMINTETKNEASHSDIIEPEDMDLGELNLENALDFSSLEDLNPHKDELNEELDFGDAMQELALKDGEEIVAEDGVKAIAEQTESPQVLDKDDVDAIKDLLDENAQALEVRENGEEHQDLALEGLESMEANNGDSIQQDNESLSLEDLDVGKEDEVKGMEIEEESSLDLSALETQEVNETPAQDSADLDGESLENAESLALEEIPQDLEDSKVEVQDISTESQMEESLDDSHLESLETVKEEVTGEDRDLQNSSIEDEFSALSLEGMGEALGEPISKEPIATSIVAENKESKEQQLPSNIQANSLEALIGALQSLQTQALKELLSGATISINIQFPKKDDK